MQTLSLVKCTEAIHTQLAAIFKISQWALCIVIPSGTHTHTHTHTRTHTHTCTHTHTHTHTNKKGTFLWLFFCCCCCCSVCIFFFFKSLLVLCVCCCCCFVVVVVVLFYWGERGTVTTNTEQYTRVSPGIYNLFTRRISMQRRYHVWHRLSEFSGDLLNCFTLSNLTTFTDVSLVKPEHSFNQLFKAILYSVSWGGKLVNC